jgi:hypothetical protein
VWIDPRGVEWTDPLGVVWSDPRGVVLGVVLPPESRGEPIEDCKSCWICSAESDLLGVSLLFPAEALAVDGEFKDLIETAVAEELRRGEIKAELPKVPEDIVR